MNRKSIVLEYNSGNKRVRLGVKIFALGLALFVSFCGGMIYLWFTGFPRTGVPIPLWMSFSMLAGVFGLSVGACCIAIGMKPPGDGSARGRKNRMLQSMKTAIGKLVVADVCLMAAALVILSYAVVVAIVPLAPADLRFLRMVVGSIGLPLCWGAYRYRSK